jgi:sterol desaturase/sphingolipid hydroxylase (fatty acid hydroxylase superfamily)
VYPSQLFFYHDCSSLLDCFLLLFFFPFAFLSFLSILCFTTLALFSSYTVPSLFLHHHRRLESSAFGVLFRFFKILLEEEKKDETALSLQASERLQRVIPKSIRREWGITKHEIITNSINYTQASSSSKASITRSPSDLFTLFDAN